MNVCAKRCQKAQIYIVKFSHFAQLFPHSMHYVKMHIISLKHLNTFLPICQKRKSIFLTFFLQKFYNKLGCPKGQPNALYDRRILSDGSEPSTVLFHFLISAIVHNGIPFGNQRLAACLHDVNTVQRTVQHRLQRSVGSPCHVFAGGQIHTA